MPHDFRPIGSLTKAVLPSATNLGLITSPSTTSPPSSETTGPQSPAGTRSRPTGTRPGETGSGDTLAITVQHLGPLMAGHDPNATDKAVEALLPPSVRSCLRTEAPARFGPQGFYAGPTRYRISGVVSDADRSAAIITLQAAQKPAKGNEILRLLTRLKVMTASRAQDADELKLQIACYKEELLRYPGDIVRHVLRTQPLHSKFWPTWSELAARLEGYADKRAKMLSVLASGSKG